MMELFEMQKIKWFHLSNKITGVYLSMSSRPRQTASVYTLNIQTKNLFIYQLFVDSFFSSFKFPSKKNVN